MPTRTSSRPCAPGPAGSCSRTSPRPTSSSRSRPSPPATRCWRPAVTRRLLDRYADRLPPVNDERNAALRDLTEREIEVLKLVGRGLSNREIAERLVLAEPTVKTHVSHVFDKLDLRDRAQAVVLAYEAGLIRPGSVPDATDTTG